MQIRQGQICMRRANTAGANLGKLLKDICIYVHESCTYGWGKSGRIVEGYMYIYTYMYILMYILVYIHISHVNVSVELQVQIRQGLYTCVQIFISIRVFMYVYIYHVQMCPLSSSANTVGANGQLLGYIHVYIYSHLYVSVCTCTYITCKCAR